MLCVAPAKTDNRGGFGIMNENNICSNCKTGRDSLILDPQSPICPYLELKQDGECRAFVPIDDTTNKDE